MSVRLHGGVLASGGQDRTVQLWSLGRADGLVEAGNEADGGRIATLTHGAAVRGLLLADEARAQSVTSAIASVQATSVYATAVQEDDDAGGYIFTWDDNTYTGGAGYYDFGYYDYGGW